MFRLVQEALNNARKYAQAQEILVKINFSAEEIQVQIIDDGKGFDLPKVLTEVAGKGSFGLLSMKERIELLSGKLDIETASGKGTKITATVAMEHAVYN